jgi:hypothetical protein
MIKVYIDAANARVTVHNNPNCAAAKIKINQDQRTVLVNTDSLSRELRHFRSNEYQLASSPNHNDIWCIIDVQDSEFENAIARHVMRLVGLGLKTTANWELLTHC